MSAFADRRSAPVPSRNGAPHPAAGESRSVGPLGAGPLTGVRIADLTIITAGAAATQMLADLGADVVKVESGRYPDPFRFWDTALTEQGVERPWDRSAPFNCVNRGKRSLTLDLKHPLGRTAFLRLVTESDVVAQNFSLGVMDRLGLGFDELRKVRPDLVMISLSSQGETGPERSYKSFGSTLDALSGMMSITGYGPDNPIWSSNEVNYPDQVVSAFGAALTLVGLRRRNRTGQAVHIDLSQRELVTSMIGEAVLEYAVNRRVPQPRANRDRSMVPHGCYRCRGEDAWVAITVQDDAQWAALADVMGRPELADDPRYATFDARWQRLDELDALITTWTSDLDKRDVMERLQRRGVPAGALLAGRELHEDPNLQARGFYRSVTHPLAGTTLQRSWPYHLSRTPSAIRGPAPCLGQHTDEVLRDLLGYSGQEIRELDNAGVTAWAPRAVRPGERRR